MQKWRVNRREKKNKQHSERGKESFLARVHYVKKRSVRERTSARRVLPEEEMVAGMVVEVPNTGC